MPTITASMCRYYTTVHIEKDQLGVFQNVCKAAWNYPFRNSPTIENNELMKTSVTVGPMTEFCRKAFDQQMKVLRLRIVNHQSEV